MKKNKEINGGLWFLVTYTLVFTITSLGVFLPFIQENRSFIWKGDGLFQTFSSMVYIGEHYKSILMGLLQGNFNPSMIDFKIGLGYDVFSTLNYYGLGDPLLLLTVFFDKENMHILYNALFILRLYLSGIGFGLYCKKMDKEKSPTLIGAVIYVFSGFAIVAGEKHPYFLNAMVYLPFLLIGIETILKKKKSYLFTFMILVSVVSNYYFFYMLTVMVFLYALIRFFDVYRKEWKQNIGNILIRGIMQYALGLLLACFALMPTIYAFLNNARGTTGSYNEGFFYKKNYYIKLLYSFFSVPFDVNSEFTFLAYAPICFFVIVFLYLFRENLKKYISLKVGYALATIMLLTPIGGYLMNGLSYSSNRWVFGYSFFTAFIVVCVLDDFLRLLIKKLIPFVLLSLILGVSLFCLGYYRTNYTTIGVISINIMIIVLVLITRIKSIRFKYLTVLLVTVFSTACFGYYQNALIGKGYVKQFRENGQAISIIENCPQSSISYEEDEAFYRIGSYGNSVINQSMTMGYFGTSSYYSLVDANVLKYMLENELTSVVQPHQFVGMDFRTYLDTFACVKYYAFEKNSAQERQIPYGYQKIGEKKRENSKVIDVIYENQNVLPLGYTYDKQISTQYYETLNPVEKQQAMMQAAVVESPNQDSKENIKFSQEDVPYEIQGDNGIIWDREKGIIKIDNKDSTLTLSFQGKKNHETYVRLVGLNIENAKVSKFSAFASSENSSSKLRLTNSKYRWDLQRENYLINLGQENDGITTCTISFEKPGEYYLKNIEVYSLDMKEYEKQVSSLANEALTDIQMSNNKITGNIEVSQDKILCFSVLYNAGWKLKIDGKEATLYQANTMYMATDITKGVHTIELIYQTPGMKIGVGISLICFVGVLGFAFYEFRRKNS